MMSKTTPEIPGAEVKTSEGSEVATLSGSPDRASPDNFSLTLESFVFTGILSGNGPVQSRVESVGKITEFPLAYLIYYLYIIDI